MSERLNGSAARMAPVNPDKPLTRTLRRVLLVLAKGGTLEKVTTRDNTPGRRHLPHPEGRVYYILRPDPRHKRFKSRKTMIERVVMAATVETLIERGHLVRFARVARAEHLSDKAREAVKATDWNGNYRKEAGDGLPEVR